MQCMQVVKSNRNIRVTLFSMHFRTENTDVEVKFAWLKSPMLGVTDDICFHFWYSIAVSLDITQDITLHHS